MAVARSGGDGLAPVIPLRRGPAAPASQSGARESVAATYAHPPPKSVVRFHIGHPFGGYYFAAIHRGQVWKTTTVLDDPGYVRRTMSWDAVLAKRPIMQLATGWEPVEISDPRLRERLPVVRFRLPSRYEVALREPRDEWWSTVEKPASPLYGYTSQKVLFRAAHKIEIATGWEDLGFPQLVSPPGCAQIAEVDRKEDWEHRERARLSGTVW